MASSERVLVGTIARAIKRAYPASLVLKIVGNPYQESGIPDLLVCVHGRFIGLEVKNQEPGESAEHAAYRATPVQRVMVTRINKAGGAAGVVTSKEQALALIERALEKEQVG